MKPIRLLFLCVMVALLLEGGIYSYFTGTEEEFIPGLETVYAENENTADKVSMAPAKQDSEKIAVVNLDKGVLVDGKKRIYANEIVRIPEGGSFEFTSLSAAKSGFESGQYAAYIVVPETFSKTVVSVNDKTPVKCDLEYAVKRKGSAATQHKVEHQVLDFVEGVKNDLSFIYMENICSEFHAAQDSAGVVMDNDLKDKAAIDSIQPDDLVEFVQIPDLEDVENETEPLDVNTYAQKDSEYVTEIGNAYSESISDARDRLSGIQAAGNDLEEKLGENATSIDESLGVLQNIDMTGPINGIRTDIATNERSDEESTGVLVGEITEATDSVEKVINDIAEAIETSNQEVEESTRAEIEEIVKSAIGAVPVVPEIIVDTSEEEKSFTITLSREGAPDEDIPKITLKAVLPDRDLINAKNELLSYMSWRLLEAMYQMETEPVSIVLDSYNRDTWSMATNNDLYYVESTGYYEDPNDPGNPIPYTNYAKCEDVRDYINFIQTDGYPVNVSVITVFNELDRDANVQQLLDDLGCESCLDFLERIRDKSFELREDISLEYNKQEVTDFNNALNSFHRDDIGEDINPKELALGASLERVDAYLYRKSEGESVGEDVDESEDEDEDEGEIEEGKKEKVLDENDEPITLYDSAKTNITTCLGNAQSTLQNGLNNRKASLYDTETGTLNGTLKEVESFVGSLNGDINTVRSDISGFNQDSKSAISDYGATIGRFSPTVDDEGVRTNSEKMTTNYSDLEQEVYTNNRSHQEYANKVREVTDNNINTLKQNIKDAQKISEDTVTEGLSDAKAVKSQTSEQNQSLMAAFAKKLPYTRLGTLENTTIYEFIVDPLSAKDLAPPENEKTQENNSSEKSPGSPTPTENLSGKSASTGSNGDDSASTESGGDDSGSSVIESASAPETNPYILPIVLVLIAGGAAVAFFVIRHNQQRNERY